MHIRTYLEEHAGILLLQIFLMVLLGGFLLAMDTEPGAVVCVLLVWAAVTGSFCCSDFYRKKKHFAEIENIFDALSEKYLFSEIIPRPADSTERLYYECSRGANKAMLDKMEETSRSSREYKEYIESWIHEVKNPMTAIDLYCNNHPSEQTGEIKRELRRIDSLVNQALYYARSGSVEKVYFVREFSLIDAVLPVLQEYRPVILEKHISLEVGELEEHVYTDPKWVGYILGQLLSNAVKYVPEEGGRLRLSLLKQQKGCWLCVEDNGRGIPQADMPRLFEKGFTGCDRKKKEATGMGLYLAKQLCGKLGLSLVAEPREGGGTLAKIGFPVGTLHKPC